MDITSACNLLDDIAKRRWPDLQLEFLPLPQQSFVLMARLDLNWYSVTIPMEMCEIIRCGSEKEIEKLLTCRVYEALTVMKKKINEYLNN